MKIDPYYWQQKRSPMFEDFSYVQIVHKFTGWMT